MSEEEGLESRDRGDWIRKFSKNQKKKVFHSILKCRSQNNSSLISFYKKFYRIFYFYGISTPTKRNTKWKISQIEPKFEIL